MLRGLGVDNSTKLFELAGASFVAALLKALGPDYNALLVSDLGKGAVLLGIDLGASFLAEVSRNTVILYSFVFYHFEGPSGLLVTDLGKRAVLLASVPVSWQR